MQTKRENEEMKKDLEDELDAQRRANRVVPRRLNENDRIRQAKGEIAHLKNQLAKTKRENRDVLQLVKNLEDLLDGRTRRAKNLEDQLEQTKGETEEGLLVKRGLQDQLDGQTRRAKNLEDQLEQTKWETEEGLLVKRGLQDQLDRQTRLGEESGRPAGADQRGGFAGEGECGRQAEKYPPQ